MTSLWNRSFYSLALVLFFMVSILFAKNKKVDSLHIGSKAPLFTLQNTAGEYVFLHDYCGQQLRKPWINKTKHVVVISFFATTCLPCQREIPHLMELSGLFKNRPVKFFLIDVGETKDKALPFIQKKKYTIPVLLDRYQVVSDKYGVHTLPRLVVIDKKGVVRRYTIGYKSNKDFVPQMQRLIDTLLKK